MRTRLLLLLGMMTATTLAGTAAHAYLLNDYFGVNPTLTYVENWQYATGKYYSAYMFNEASLAPTQHTTTADYQVDDWFGRWSPTIFGAGFSYDSDMSYPSGEEPYDTEAYYFDDDASNLYFAAIVGFPSPETGRFVDSRTGKPIIQGDFAIDVGNAGSQTDSWDFNYNYGVDLADDNAASPSTLATNTLGSGVYSTTGGWYLGSPDAAVNPTTLDPSNSYTNFDPSSGIGMTQVGNATVDWYQLSLPHLENNWQTYVIEVTIPKTLIPSLSAGDEIQFQWLAGCRNDGSSSSAYLTGSGDVDTPEPGTVALMLAGVGPLGLWLRRRRSAA